MVVSIFALLGAWLAAAYMPALLDAIFVTVERANINAAKGEFPEKPLRDPDKVDPGSGASEPVSGPEDGTQAQGSDPVKFSEAAEKLREQGVDPERSTGYPGSSNPGVLAAMALLGAIIGGALGNVAYILWSRGVQKWDLMEPGGKVSLFIGVFAGIVASIPFLFAFQGLGGIAAPLLTIALVLGFSSLSILALKSMEEVLPWNKSRVQGKRTGKKILDTNVIIDGRIIDLARTGFLEGELYVPKFVIDELQHIADSPDALRRQRGRRGLEILRILQTDYSLVVGTEDGKVEANGEVDDRLVKLAKALGGDLVSNDFNLNKVAGLQSVRVLNINDLALSLRPNVLPGENLTITIIREGNQHGQGVGYLEDGTMVVVERGREHIGDTVDTTVTQVIQTERGKMIFADSPSPYQGKNGR
jgi:uncharacterized protein YacL